MINVEMMHDEERIRRASGLTLRAIADEGYLNKGMWLKHLRAAYSSKNYARSNCSSCHVSFYRNVQNFATSKTSPDRLGRTCRGCIAKKKKTARLLKLRRED